MNRVKRLAKTILDQVRWFAHVQLLNLFIILYLKRGLSSAALNFDLFFFFCSERKSNSFSWTHWNTSKMKLSETGTGMRQHVDGNVVTLVVTQKVASAFRKLFE